MSNIRYFFNLFPDERYKSISKEKLSIYNTTLSDIILNNKTKEDLTIDNEKIKKISEKKAKESSSDYVNHVLSSLKDNKDEFNKMISMLMNLGEDGSDYHGNIFLPTEDTIYKLEKELESDKSNVKKIAELAYLYESTENYDLALKKYMSILDIESFNVRIISAIADCNYRMDNIDKSIEILSFYFSNKVNFSKAERAEIGSSLGYYLIAQFSFEKALEVLEESLEMSNNDSYVNKNIGHLYLIQSDNSRAVVYYKQALENYGSGGFVLAKDIIVEDLIELGAYLDIEESKLENWKILVKNILIES